jgi:hypothetical protein
MTTANMTDKKDVPSAAGGAPNVTATIANQTPYTFTYSTQKLTSGTVTINAKTIDASSSAQAFFAMASPGTATGCEGTVTYSFTDQNGTTQNISFFYEDPYANPNKFSVTAPAGISSKNNGPANGFQVAVTYTISGSVTAS